MFPLITYRLPVRMNWRQFSFIVSCLGSWSWYGFWFPLLSSFSHSVTNRAHSFFPRSCCLGSDVINRYILCTLFLLFCTVKSSTIYNCVLQRGNKLHNIINAYLYQSTITCRKIMFTNNIIHRIETSISQMNQSKENKWYVIITMEPNPVITCV